MSSYSVLNQIIVFLLVDVILGFFLYLIYVVIGSLYHNVLKNEDWTPKKYNRCRYYRYRQY